MKKIAILMAIITASFLAGCGDDSITDDNPNSSDTYKGATLEVYTDDVKTCTPFIGEVIFASGSSVLSLWEGWDRNNSNGVLGKVFNTTLDNDEGLFTQIAILDEHIALVNSFTDSFDEEGSATVGSNTATVETDISSVEVPFLSWFFQELMSVPVDRVITVTSGSLTVHMAFRITGNEETIVEQYTEGSDAGVYYAVRNGSYLGVWHASVRERKVQFVWDGNMDDQVFRISECTDSGGNWEVMGGGSRSTGTSQMSFMARDDATSGSGAEYYITTTLQDFSNGSEVSIFNAATTPPNGAGSKAYITVDNADCLGFYRTGDYPESTDDLDWNN